LSHDRCEQVLTVLRGEFEKAGQSTTELTIDRLFTQERPAADIPGHRTHRGRVRRRDPIPPEKRGDGRQFAELVREAEAQVPDGISGRRASEEILGMNPNTLSRHRRAGIGPTPRLIGFGPLRVDVYSRKDIRAHARSLLQPTEPRRAALRDPQKYYEWLLDHHVPKQRARQLRDRLETMLDEHRKIRVGTGAGRPKSSGPPPHHYEWAQRFAELKLELDERHEVAVANGFTDDPPPTELGVALAVAHEDYDAHPQRWRYRPSNLPDEAARRVRNAINRLQIPGTEVRAT
jgi:hypothetical protein